MAQSSIRIFELDDLVSLWQQGDPRSPLPGIDYKPSAKNLRLVICHRLPGHPRLDGSQDRIRR